MVKRNNYISEFLNYLNNEKNFSQHTISAYKTDLTNLDLFIEKYEGNLSFEDVDRSIIQFYLSEISERNISAKTLSRKIATIKSFFRYLVEQEILDKNIAKGIAFPKIPKKLPTFLSEKEIEKLMDSPRIHSKNPVKDKLILELLYSSGMRISELVSIKLQNIRLEEGLIKVLGKGNIERQVIVGSFAKKSLKKYLSIMDLNSTVNSTEYLFPNERKNSKTGHISIRKVYGDVKKILFLATGNDALSPHSIRHSTATHLLENGTNLISVKEILGHSSLKSTQVYTHVQKEHMSKIYKQAHPEGN
jgi:site-specific recombinase XerD